MQYIDKFHPENRKKGLRINQEVLDSHWNAETGEYFSMRYKDFDKKPFNSLLSNEQGGLCCYCMRRLHVNAERNHRKNVTLEHVVPNKITSDEWNQDKGSYQKFRGLTDEFITVCPSDGVIDKKVRFGMPPFPHFIAYDNLVASCDGQTLNYDATEVNHHCCNNYRGNRYVEPLYFHVNVGNEIDYDSFGRIVCEEEVVKYLDEKTGVNIMSPFLNKVRMFWNLVSASGYTPEDIRAAEDDEELRQDIRDDLFTTDGLGEWEFLEDEVKWAVYADYDWFYTYYRNKAGVGN